MGKEATLNSLEKMLGAGDGFKAGGHPYKVLPLLLTEIPDFVSDNIPIEEPFYVMVITEMTPKLDKWLSAKVRDARGEAVTLERATADGWDLENLRECLRRMALLSG